MGGKDCPESLPCCSASGFCGISEAHCGAGCDPNHSFNGKCEIPGKSQDPKPELPSTPGDKCGGVKCTAEFPCCGEFNFCGSTPGHCGKGCQAGKSFNRVCHTPKPPVNPKKPVVKCGKRMCNALAPCCSKNNVCGN